MEVDLALSAHANARRWYELKKKQESKQEKTVTAHEKAFKAAEKKTRLQLSQVASPSMVSKLKIFIVVCKSVVLILYFSIVCWGLFMIFIQPLSRNSVRFSTTDF